MDIQKTESYKTVGDLIEGLKKLDPSTKIAYQCGDSGGTYSEIMSGIVLETGSRSNFFRDANDDLNAVGAEDIITVITSE